MDRRALLAAGDVAAPTSLLDLLPQQNHAPAPAEVRRKDIEQVLTAATALSGWDNVYGGGGLIRSSLLGQLAWARGLLQADCPPALEHDLFTAVGRLAVVMGASAFDAYEHQDAARLLHFGRQCAEHAANWHLRATALNWLARQAIWCGRPDDGLTHADNGLVRADRLTHREQAMLHNARARALAKMGKPKDTLRAIGQSDAIFSHARPGEDVPWMTYKALSRAARPYSRDSDVAALQERVALVVAA